MILIIGANGFIGRSFSEFLYNKNHKNIVLCDRSLSNFTSLNDVKKIEKPTYELNEADLEGITQILLLASASVPSSSMLNINRDIYENVKILTDVVSICSKLKDLKRIIFFSSAGTVYGECAYEATEQSALRPKCSYGVVKLTLENYLKMFKDLYGIDFVSLRVSNPYGVYQFGSPVGSIVKFLSSIIDGHQIQIFGDGAIVRDYIHIDDLCDAVEKVLNNDALSQEIYNLAFGKSYSLNSVIALIEEKLNKKAIVNYSPTRDFDVKNVYICSDLLKKEIDWMPKLSIGEGIQKIISQIDSKEVFYV